MNYGRLSLLAGAACALSAVGVVSTHALLVSDGPGVARPAAPTAGWVAAAAGQVEPHDGFVRLASSTPGRIVEIRTAPGDHVHAGDVLVRLADDEAAARLRAAEAVLEATGKRAELVHAVEDQASVKVRKEFSVAGEPVQANPPGASVEAAQADVSIARIELGKTLIRAPSDGVILAMDRHVGETIGNAQDDVVVTMGDLRGLSIRAELDEIDAGKIKVGDPVVVKSDNVSAGPRGVVTKVAPLISRRTLGATADGRGGLSNVQTVMIEIAGGSGLLPGARVDVYFSPQRKMSGSRSSAFENDAR